MHAATIDLLGDPVPEPTVAPITTGSLLELEGVLHDNAHVAMHASDHGHAHPVLQMRLDKVGPGLHQVAVEKHFRPEERFLADALALRLKQGTHVRVRPPLAGSRLTLPHAESVVPLS